LVSARPFLLCSFTAKPKAQAGPQCENCGRERFGAERIRACRAAVAYGSAVNEGGGKRRRRSNELAERKGDGGQFKDVGGWRSVSHASRPLFWLWRRLPPSRRRRLGRNARLRPRSGFGRQRICGAERIRAAAPAVAYGSAVNEGGE
jgi:hypothetical protein